MSDGVCFGMGYVPVQILIATLGTMDGDDLNERRVFNVEPFVF